MRISQIELVGAISKALEKQGVKQITTRQFNVIIHAANAVVEAMGLPYIPALTNSGLSEWFKSDDTGMSSLFIAWVLQPNTVPTDAYTQSIRYCASAEKSYPRDPDDFGRCYKLLRAVPEFQNRMPEVAAAGGPVWERLIANWKQLETLYEQEAASGFAPNLYARMKELIVGR